MVRVCEAPVGRPQVDELTVVPILVMVMWLNAFCALTRMVTWRRVSAMRKERPKLELKEVWKSPGMVLRPALPYWPASGSVKAARLKYGPAPPAIGRPVAWARPVPKAAVPPVLARLPETRAVSGVPL